MMSMMTRARTSSGPMARTAAVALAALATLAALAMLAPRGLGAAPAAGDPTQPGPHAVETGEASYAFEGDAEQLDLYYAADASGMPAVVLLPTGQFGDAENNAGHAEHLASWGYAVGVMHGVGVRGGSDITENGEQAVAALDALLAATPLEGRLAEAAAAVGTHMNGESALRAAALDDRVRAVVGLHPNEMPLGRSDAARSAVPFLAMGGQPGGGFLCVYDRSFRDIYRRAGAAHKLRVDFPDAVPADFQDPPYTGTGDTFCGAARDTPFAWITGLMTAWLEYYVRGDASYFDVLYAADGAPDGWPETGETAAANAPLGLEVTPTGSAEATLRWTAPISRSAVLAGFTVQRKAGDGPWQSVAELPLTARQHTDSGLSAELSYQYVVRYRDEAGHLFQPSDAVAIEGGAPTATPPPPTATASPTTAATASPTRSPSATASPTTVGPTTTATPRPSPTSASGDGAVLLPAALKGASLGGGDGT